MRYLQVKVKDDLHYRFKVACAKAGDKMVDVVIKAAEEYIKTVEQAEINKEKGK